MKTQADNANIFATYYADDALEITLSLEQLQTSIDNESELLSNWSLECNPSRSKIIHCHRSKQVKNETFPFKNDLYMKEKSINWNKFNSNVVDFFHFI